MEEKKYTCIQPVYMNSFQCDGNACRSKCCRNWTIDIDGNTYQRYCGIEPKEERKRITSHLKLAKRGGAKGFVVKLRRDGSCPFLREDFFCELQKNYGESFLSTVCATYPRIRNIIGESTMEMGLVLSCPIAARLILKAQEPMGFEEVGITESRPMTSTKLNRNKTPLLDDLPDLQKSCISLMQDRRLTLDQRLILMGNFLKQVEELAAGNRKEEIRPLAEGYASDQNIENAAEITGEISLDIDRYLCCVFGMVETLYGRGTDVRTLGDTGYLAALKELYKLEKGQEKAPLSAFREIYEGYRPEAKEIVRQYSYLFENCMVNEFFINMYPLRNRATLTENYFDFIMRYKLMEFLTTALVIVLKNDTREDTIVNCLGYFSERMDHNKPYRDHIFKEILKYDRDMKAFMCTLLDGRKE